MNKKIWVICLALYLLIACVLSLTNITVVAVNIIQGILAGVSAVCLFIDK